MIGKRYSLDREIGRGGMGAVWLGRDEVLGRPVAVKRVGMAPGGTSPDLKRAEREARIAASLNHPHIVGVFDLVDDEDQQYLVMEYVEGTTLAELIRSRGALDRRDAARLLSQVASALAAAHASGIVHRDVKPSNILVRPDGQVKLSDFGIARTLADASLTQTGLVTGSPAYLAPEVASGQLATTASDVWAIGATLYHALSGRTPYDVGDNVLGALYQIVNEPPPRLPDAGEMSAVLQATMAHDADSRWTMDDVARALEQLAHAAPGTRPVPVRAPEPASVPPDSSTRTLRTETGKEPPATAVAVPPVAVRPVARTAEEDSASRKRRPVLPVLVAVVVVALIGVIGALVLLDDPQDATPPPGAGPGSTSSTTTSESPETPEPSTPASSPAERAPTPAQMRDFIASYLETASTDPAAAFERLTPGFKSESGGLSGYEAFWGGVSNARLVALDADPDAMTVSYRYSYDYEDGAARTEEVFLQLVEDGDGGLLIDGEA